MANDGERMPRFLGRPKKMFGTGGGFQCWTTTNGPDISDLAERLDGISKRRREGLASKARSVGARVANLAGKVLALEDDVTEEFWNGVALEDFD